MICSRAVIILHGARTMLHSPLFFVWTGKFTACVGWVLVVGVIAVWRWRRVQQENAARKYPDLTGLGDLSPYF